jgi:hypothetical protein
VHEICFTLSETRTYGFNQRSSLEYLESSISCPPTNTLLEPKLQNILQSHLVRARMPGDFPLRAGKHAPEQYKERAAYIEELNQDPVIRNFEWDTTARQTLMRPWNLEMQKRYNEEATLIRSVSDCFDEETQTLLICTDYQINQ